MKNSDYTHTYSMVLQEWPKSKEEWESTVEELEMKANCKFDKNFNSACWDGLWYEFTVIEENYERKEG